MEQGSKEWLEYRRAGIGSSDAPIIMGVSKFCTPYELWRQKTYGEDNEANPFITNKGHEIEDKARALYEIETGLIWAPIIGMHKNIPWLRVSLDGHNKETNTLWECKLLGEEDFLLLKKDCVPPQYLPQLQHQLMVTGAEKVILYGYCDTDEVVRTATTVVLPDLPYIKILYQKEKEFWEMVQRKIQPQLTDKDVIPMIKKELKDNALRYLETKEKIEILKTQLTTIKDVVFKQMDHTKMVLDGKATFNKTTGRITLTRKKK